METFNKMAYDQETVFMWQQVTHQCRIELAQAHRRLEELEADSVTREELQTRVNELEAELSNTQNQLGSTNQTVDDAVKQLDIANGEVNCALADISRLNAEITKLNDKITELSGEGAAAKEALDDMRAVAFKRDGLLQDVADVNGELWANMVDLASKLDAVVGGFTVDGGAADKYMQIAAMHECAQEAIKHVNKLRCNLLHQAQLLAGQNYVARTPDPVEEISHAPIEMGNIE